jgi:hypothetical protein
VFESIIGWGLFLAGFAVPVVLFWGILRQAGYSGVYALLWLVPCVNLIVLVVFACKEWPVSQELARRRLADGEGREEDAVSVLYQAFKLEKRGEWDRAIELCQLIVDKGPAVREDAKQFIRQMREKYAAGMDA